MIKVVDHTSIIASPNTITQKVGAKGGIDRNYYGADGRQSKQISNNDHANPKHHDLGQHGEHAHDYIWSDDGVLTRDRERELTGQERRENADIL